MQRAAGEPTVGSVEEQAASLAEFSIPGFNHPLSTFRRRQLETIPRDRVGLRVSMLLPLALDLVVLGGFSSTRFRDPLMPTRMLARGEEVVLAAGTRSLRAMTGRPRSP